jgi:hypothetical protein
MENPGIELGGDTGVVKAPAQAAEELGTTPSSSTIMSSVPFMPGEPKLTSPHKETDPFHEPLITYAYLAGVHHETRVGAHTSVYTLHVKVPGNPHPWYERRGQ